MNNFYIDWLNSYQFHGIKPGLKRIKKILQLLGNPHKAIKTIHVAGTNGKGSTSVILKEMLINHGLKVALYLSPHLFKLNERFQINSSFIKDDELKRYLKIIKDKVRDLPATYFEITTALAFLYFFEKKVDLAIIECGMGGRLDATNIIKPEVSIITTIGWDHTKYLGKDLFKIASEKAGIIKKGVPCVLGIVKKKLISIFQEKANRMKSPIFIANRDFYIEFKDNKWNYKGKYEFLNLELNLKGYYQGNNLACALKALEILEEKRFLTISERKLREALKKVNFPGRYNLFKIQNKTLLIDVAHNIDGFIALKESLEKDNFKDFSLILGITNEDGEKPFYEMLKILIPLSKKIYLCEFISPRKIVSLEEWRKKIRLTEKNYTKFEFIENCEKAIKISLDDQYKNILITGSIYFVAECFKVLKKFLKQIKC